MRRLSSTLDRMADRYDVVVVGSGYGGAIVAARLAAAGCKVCVLERGREYLPGDFPATLWEGMRQFQWRRRGQRHGARNGLFDLRAGHDLSVLVGCGLGGTSLINAGVALRPPAWVFDDARWPAELRGQGSDVLAPYLARAEHMLGVTAYPEDWPRLPKVDALAKAAAALGGNVEHPPVAVNFGRRTDPYDGSPAPTCELCGDCVAGCNYGAKNTVTANYLPLAVAHGAQIFTEAEVRTVLPAPESAQGAWIVSFDSTADHRGRFGDAPSLFVHADAVVLAAGARLHGDPVSFPHGGPGRIPSAGPGLQRQRRRARVRL
jgi:cholesterol oxidase